MIGFRASWQGAEAEGFIAEMDRALAEMMADGTIDQIIATAVAG